MGMFKSKFESAKQDWATPQDLFDKLHKEFDFTFDLAADSGNAKCKNYFSKEDNALLKGWRGACWLNPPYGQKGSGKLSDWVRKSYEETKDSPDTTVVMLIPARTNTKWWHNYCMRAYEIKLICGRPKFGDAEHGLPQPLALVVFKRHNGSPKLSSFTLP
jgi:phage N-6-adenine-methyltransferase